MMIPALHRDKLNAFSFVIEEVNFTDCGLMAKAAVDRSNSTKHRLFMRSPSYSEATACREELDPSQSLTGRIPRIPGASLCGTQTLHRCRSVSPCRACRCQLPWVGYQTMANVPWGKPQTKPF